MNVDILISITILTFLAGCSWFSNPEEIDIKNPKPGMELEVKQEEIPKPK